MHATYKEVSPLFGGNSADSNLSESTNHGIKDTTGHKREKLAIFVKRECSRTMESSSVLYLKYNSKFKTRNSKYFKRIKCEPGGKKKSTHNTAIWNRELFSSYFSIEEKHKIKNLHFSAVFYNSLL